MLDVENILYAGVTKLLRERHEGISVYGCEVDSPASFPAVTFVESDNSTYKRSLSGDNIEHNASLMKNLPKARRNQRKHLETT